MTYIGILILWYWVAGGLLLEVVDQHIFDSRMLVIFLLPSCAPLLWFQGLNGESGHVMFGTFIDLRSRLLPSSLSSFQLLFVSHVANCFQQVISWCVHSNGSRFFVVWRA